MKIVWLGHSAFLIYCNGKKILIDPFISGNRNFPISLKKEIENPDFIVITHGHSDHVGDTLKLYNPGITKVISNFEICNWLFTKGVKNIAGMNTGGTYTEYSIKFSMVQAIHSSSMEDGDKVIYGGLAAGFVINDGKNSVYHFGDTDIFTDMSLIQKIYSPDIGLVPIGGKFTMPPKVAAMACNEFFRFKNIIPMHYGTFPAINGSASEFSVLVNDTKTVSCLKPGEYLEL